MACARIGAMRCHSLALTMASRKATAGPLTEIEKLIQSGNEWVKWVPNERSITEKELTPVTITGTLKVGVGRVRSFNMGPEYISAFVCGDQLLWGAAEPLRWRCASCCKSVDVCKPSPCVRVFAGLKFQIDLKKYHSIRLGKYQYCPLADLTALFRLIQKACQTVIKLESLQTARTAQRDVAVARCQPGNCCRRNIRRHRSFRCGQIHIVSSPQSSGNAGSRPGSH